MTGIVIGGVVVAPEASELILPIAVAVQNRLTVKDLAYTFSVYPSLSGSITELGAAADARRHRIGLTATDQHCPSPRVQKCRCRKPPAAHDNPRPRTTAAACGPLR